MRLPGHRRRPTAPLPPARDGALFDLAHLASRPRAENEAAIRRLCHAVPLPRSVLCRVLGRYKMHLDPADESLSPHLMLDGYWKMWVTEVLPGFVRKGMTVLDAGARLGYYSLLMADLVGPAGRVHAVEPNPRLLGLLQRSAGLNGFGGRIVPHAAALTGAAGEQGAHLLASMTVDGIVGDGPLDAIKIGVDGAEEQVWRGMAGVLARRRPLAVFLEFTPDRHADPAGFLRAILGEGFSLAVVEPDGGARAASAERVLEGAADQDRMLVLAR